MFLLTLARGGAAESFLRSECGGTWCFLKDNDKIIISHPFPWT